MVQLGILSSLFNHDFSPSYAARDKRIKDSHQMTALECSIKINLFSYFRVCGLIVNQEDMPFTDLVGTIITKSVFVFVFRCCFHFYLIR